MRITNKTSYPDNEVRQLVRFGMKGLAGMTGLSVTVVPSRKHASGHAWWGWRQEVILRLPPAHTFPKRGWQRHRSSPINHDYQNWQEALVALSAHEGRHIDLHYGRGVWNNSQEVEMACEAWEHKRLHDYRNLPQSGDLTHAPRTSSVPSVNYG